MPSTVCSFAKTLTVDSSAPRHPLQPQGLEWGSGRSFSGPSAGSMLFCWSQGRPSVGTGVSYRRASGTGYSVLCARAGPNTRELCQSVCSSAIYRIPRPSRICASICRVLGRQRKSCSPPIGKPDVHAASLSSTTPIALSPRKRSGDSISNLSRAGHWRSAKRGHGKIVPPDRGREASAAVRGLVAVRRQGSAVHDPVASRPVPRGRRRFARRPQPEFRSRCASEEQAEGAARQGRGSRPPRTDQGTPGWPALRRRRRLARERRCRGGRGREFRHQREG